MQQPISTHPFTVIFLSPAYFDPRGYDIDETIPHIVDCENEKIVETVVLGEQSDPELWPEGTIVEVVRRETVFIKRDGKFVIDEDMTNA